MSVELEVQRIQRLVQERRFAEALTAADALLVSVPENRDLLYVRALAQRMLGDIPTALATLARLVELHPRFSRGYQERGQCYVALKQAPEAIEAFMRAVHMNPALPVSWSMLEGLFRMTRQAQNAAEAAAHVATLKNLPPEVVTANALFCDGDLAEAERLIREFLVRHGHHVEAMRLLARIGLERDVLDDAQLLLEGVLDVAPDYHAARFEYAQVLIKRHMHQSAREQAERLLAADPSNRNYRTLHALTFVGVGQHERAIEIYRELLTGATQPADLHLSIAHSLKTLGHREEAIAAYRAAAAARAGYGDVYWSLANLKTYRFDDAELATMRAAESATSTATVDRYHLCFALGKALEDRQEYAESFAYYARGNALKRAESRYKPEVMELNTRLQSETCTRELFARHGAAATGRSRSSRRTPPLKALRSWRTFLGSLRTSAAATPISTTRSTQRFWLT
jgi:tetratricopeptide (TPR) repeat protein